MILVKKKSSRIPAWFGSGFTFQLAVAINCIIATSALAGGRINANSKYWRDAQIVHNWVAGNYLTTSGSYRTKPHSTTAYEWYCVSQISADAAMLETGDTRYLAYMTNTYAWMTNLWDLGSPSGGYFDSANVNGSGVGTTKYVDDNSLAGNVYLDCYAITRGQLKTNFLNSAMATANWLMFSGQWDSTFGGGFWWSTGKQNKPTQSNGLAMQLFLRLYQITGQTYYRDWANSIKDWLENQMYDSTDGLYGWQITTNGTATGDKDLRKFTYDNSIMIEADLLYYQVMTNSAYLSKAQNLANRLNARLWNNTYGSYYFITTDGRVNPCWCGWASQSLIRLYQVDGNTNWLNFAQRNIDYMNSHLFDKKFGGYYQFCNMDGSNLTTNQLEGVDQAWMQRVQAMISAFR